MSLHYEIRKNVFQFHFGLCCKSENLFHALNYSAGGPALITDMRRGETIFEIDPQLQVLQIVVLKLKSTRYIDILVL